MGCDLTAAVSILLASDWLGDLVVLTGEHLWDLTYEGIAETMTDGLWRVCNAGIDYYDIEYEFANVVDRFECCRGREGWRPPADESEEQLVYELSCDRRIERYRCVVNETKGGPSTVRRRTPDTGLIRG